MEQTAVEWLAEQMMHPSIHNPYIEQAKEMEKQQIIYFACEVYNSHYYRGDKSFKKVAEEYYIQTYKR
jgi:hypothetical protein